MDGHNDPTDGLQKCPICLEDPMPVPIMQACSVDNTHVMCGKCWKKTGPGDRCPLCRADGPVQEIQNGARIPKRNIPHVVVAHNVPYVCPHVVCSVLLEKCIENKLGDMPCPMRYGLWRTLPLPEHDRALHHLSCAHSQVSPLLLRAQDTAEQAQCN